MIDNSQNKTYVIAEVGTAHLGSLDKAKKLIEAARSSGADCVKFQIVYADEILHPQTGFVQLPTGNIPLYQRFKELEVAFDFYAKCREICAEFEVDFSASPFGFKSYNQLIALNPAMVKIASPELNHIPLLREIAKNPQQKNIPLFLSSGVSKLSDIEKALETLTAIPVKVLLHCVTSYPAPEHEYNLNILKNLANIFQIPVGVSDHSLHPYLVPLLSIACTGCAVEKHICLSKNDCGLDDPVALPPADFLLMTKKIRQAEKMSHYELIESLKDEFGNKTIDLVLGTGKKELACSEKENYEKTNRSVHFVKSLVAGEKIAKTDIAVLRTEKILSPGIHPEFFDFVLGSVLTQDVKDGQGVQWEHLLMR